MVVDDELDIVNTVLGYLRLWKFEAEGFTSPDKALEAFRKNPVFYSLLITDLRMPGMTGFELAAKIIQIRADSKVVLMTAFELDAAELEFGHPIITYKEILRKPFRLREICDTVKKKLQLEGN